MTAAKTLHLVMLKLCLTSVAYQKPSFRQYLGLVFVLNSESAAWLELPKNRAENRVWSRILSTNMQAHMATAAKKTAPYGGEPNNATYALCMCFILFSLRPLPGFVQASFAWTDWIASLGVCEKDSAHYSSLPSPQRSRPSPSFLCPSPPLPSSCITH